MTETAEWGSDAIAHAIRQTGVPFVTLNPGASFRGLHDSIVNQLGNERPEMLVCLHEEHAVAIAHGYAKVTGEPLAVILHSNVGLMHGTMAIFNGWCDRVPMVLIGANGPLDADVRRPWIDWIHTSSDMGALVRNFVKWDDQPMSVDSSVDSILRANQLTRTYPSAPTYVCVDAAVQEQKVESWSPKTAARYAPAPDALPSRTAVEETVRLLAGAQRPVILAGRTERDRQAWDQRIALAERLNARVITDQKMAAAFPTRHRLHGDAAGNALSQENRRIVAGADVILSLEWEDLGGTLRTVFGGNEPEGAVIAAGSEHQLFNGWTKNDYALSPVDVRLDGRPGVVVNELLDALEAAQIPARDVGSVDESGHDSAPDSATEQNGLALPGLACELREALGDRDTSLIRVPTSWDTSVWPLDHPLAYLGSDGGGGIGSGPGMAVGAALALRGSGRLPVAVLGDGDYLMGLTALWTAARYGIGLLIVVANNGSYFNDELHQNRMAIIRDRPRENAHIGMRMEEPAPDLAGLARDQGLSGYGPVVSRDDLRTVLRDAIIEVEAGAACVVDVRIERGYSAVAAADVLNDRSALAAQSGASSNDGERR